MSGNHHPTGLALLPQRIGATLKSAAKLEGARWIRVVRQIDRELEPVSSSPCTSAELRDGLACIALIEETQLRIVDDLHTVPVGTDVAIYILTINADEGQELARDKLRLRVPQGTEIVQHGPAPGSKDWEPSAEAKPSAAVMQTAMMRQQYRHNEAMAKTLVGSQAGLGAVVEKMSGLVGTLADKLEQSHTARARDAENMISVSRQQRLLEAEARTEELKGEAMKSAANTLSEWLPVAFHKIARKYGLSGDDAIDPMIEKMVLSFKVEQLDGLATVLSPVQMQMFGDLWCTIKDRAEARKKKADEAKKIDGGKPDAAKLPANGANGASGAAA